MCVALYPPPEVHRYLHNLKRAKQNDRIFQYGIDKMELDTRLIKRYQQLVHNHTHPNGYLHAGMKATMDTKSSFAQTQALWRFVHNDNISYQELSKPLLENSLQGCREDCKRYGLVMHDWSRLSLTHHNKQDTYAMTHNLDVGYELQSSVLVSDINGSPIATPAQNLVTANGVHSSYQDTPAKQTHLNELTTRIEYLEQQGFDKPLIHIIDREADSAYHMRQWDEHDYKFITRVKAGSYLSYEGKSQRCSQIAGQLNFSYQRQVNYKGKAAKQYIATAKVVLTRSAKPQAIDPATGKRIAPIKGKPLSLLLTVSRIYDDQDKRLATWYLLSNLQETSVKGADISQWYYWRWQIESYFKLLKSAGLQLESWLQQSGDAYFKRLLIASQACTLVWRIMQASDKQSKEFALFLVRLSGRQMKRSKPITAPAVMAGLFQWLNFTELVNHYPPDKLREFADAASKFV